MVKVLAMQSMMLPSPPPVTSPLPPMLPEDLVIFTSMVLV